MSEGDRALDLWLAEHVIGGVTRNAGGNVYLNKSLVAARFSRDPNEVVAIDYRGRQWEQGEGDLWINIALPHYTGRDYLQLAEALQGEPHKFEVCLWFYPAQPWAPAHCEASIWAEGKPSPVAEESADTPGLALGRAAEQALGGAGQNGE